VQRDRVGPPEVEVRRKQAGRGRGEPAVALGERDPVADDEQVRALEPVEVEPDMEAAAVTRATVAAQPWPQQSSSWQSV